VIDQMTAISERRSEDIVAAIFGEKPACGFIVNFDGPAAGPVFVRIHVHRKWPACRCALAR
jgi:hypothetical protein